MRYFATISTAVVLVLFSSAGLAGKPLKVGEPAPDWILTDGQGQNISFYHDSADQQAVILFWATWCPRCAELMPQLKTIQEEFKQVAVKFYALNVWEDGDAIQFMADHNYDFTLLLDADLVAKRYNIKGTPGLLVVDKDKIIRYIHFKVTSAKDAATHVRQALLENNK